MSVYAPIALFVYKRLELTIQAIESLKKNNLARDSHLYIFSSAAESAAYEERINQVRKYLASVDGFASVTVIAATKNIGGANSIIAGISKIFEQYEKIIVVEDDLVVTPNFLDYMNAALDFYADKKIFSISGWSMALDFAPDDKADVYYLPRHGSWGWATWKDRWEKVDWAVSDYNVFKNDKAARKKFNRGGSDLSRMLAFQVSGKIGAYDIRCCYTQYKLGMLTVYPKISKVDNRGFGPEATHMVCNPNYKVILDDTNKTAFDFGAAIAVDPRLLKEHNYFVSIPYRVKIRVMAFLRAIGKIFS